MKKRLFSTIIILVLALPLFAVGAGLYYPDRPGYMTTSGEAYSWTDGACASATYPINSILRLVDPVSGKDYSVHVNDVIALPPDRTIALNAAAAKDIGLDRIGYMTGDVEVIYEGEDSPELKDGGWWRFDVALAESNRSAIETMNVLRENNMKPSAEVTEGGILISVRWIPKYQKLTVEQTLKALGFTEAVSSEDVNPYLL